MKRLLLLMAVSEGLTGLIVLVSPAIVTRLLFDAEIAGAGVFDESARRYQPDRVGRGVLAGPRHAPGVPGMLTYSLLATLYLAYVGVNGRAGILLWPAVAAHAALCALLVWAWRKERRAAEA